MWAAAHGARRQAQRAVLLLRQLRQLRAGAQALAQAQQANPGANYVAVDVDPSETTADVREFLTANQAGRVAYALDTDASLTRAYQLTQLSTAVVLDATGTTVYRGVDPTPDQIHAALTTAGAR